MTLADVKAATGKSWKALAEASGVHAQNLVAIAQGKRGWDTYSGAGLRRIGVDLNEQTAHYLRVQAELAKADAA